MDSYRIDARSMPPLDVPRSPPDRRRAVRVAIAVSALGHVALLAGAWLRAPTPPEPPRTAEVRVLMGQATASDDASGEPGFRIEGYARARVRAR